jgi:aryl-alcohol dehydrogenase-like predicted oxidoreductase
MQMVPLGKTGLTVSRIGLGLAALGRPGYINLGHAEDLGKNYDVREMEARTHAMLDSAYQAGVRYFDAARSYGRAEEFLGSWLRKSPERLAGVTVGSKWGYTYTADWQVRAQNHEIKDHSLSVLRRQWAESQQHLNGFLNIYQIHSVTWETWESGVLNDVEVLRELAALKAAGVKIGLSISGKGQPLIMNRAIGVVLDGVRLFDTFQVTWNLLEQTAQLVFKTAQELGIGIIVKEALANGRLTDRNTDPAFAAKRQILEKVASRLHTSVDALALAAALATGVDVVLSGAARPEHLASNLKALEVNLDEKAWAELSKLRESPEEYWNTRKALEWN